MKIVGCDYDGTLFFHKDLDVKDIQAIHDFRAAGNLFGLVTGRSLSWILGEMLHYGIEYDFLVLTNGGFALDKDLNEIYRLDIAAEDAEKLIEWLLAGKHAFSVSDGIGYYNSNTSSSYPYGFRKPIGKKSYELNEIMEQRIYNKFVILGMKNETSKDSFESLVEKFTGKINFHFNQDTLDISSPLASKEYGMKRIGELFVSDDIYVIGDSFNDVGMLKEFVGFAMESGSKEAKAVADYTVESVAEALGIIEEL